MAGWSKHLSLFERRETRPTPKAIYNFRIYWAAALSSWVAIIIGYDAGFIGGAVTLTSFESEFGLDKLSDSEVSYISETIISLFQAGAFFGALFTYPLAFFLGRKISLVVATFFLLVGTIVQMCASSSTGLGPMYAGRVITGLGIGAVSNVAPMYSAEIAPPSIRGQIIGFYEIAWQIGGAIGFWINYGTSVNIPDSSKSQWLIPVALQMIPPGILAIGVFTLPESPRWLYGAGKTEKAIKNLCYLRKLDENDDYLQYELNIIKDEIREREQTIGLGFLDPVKTIITSKSLMHRLGLLSSSFIIQNTVAVNAVNYYSPKIFQSIGMDSTESSLLSTGIFGIIKCFACLIWSFTIVDKFGRRTSCLWGLVGCSLPFWYIGAYIKISDPAARIASGDSSLDRGGQGALALFYIWTISYAFSWSGTPWVWNSEAFSSNLRSVTSAVSAASNWFWAFILARFTNQMIDSLDYGIFFFFAGCMTVCWPIYYLLYPETKNIPVEYIDELFKYKPWRAHGIIMDQIKQDRSREGSVRLPSKASCSTGVEEREATPSDALELDEVHISDKEK